MGFPSPASDYDDMRISLDQQLISCEHRVHISGKEYVTYCLRWFTAGIRNRWGIQDQAISDSTGTTPDNYGERKVLSKGYNDCAVM